MNTSLWHDKYQFAYDFSPPMAMDALHVRLLYELYQHPSIRTVLEIGSYAGYSSSAIVEAINDNFLVMARLCDLVKLAQLNQVLSLCNQREAIKYTSQSSLEVISLATEDCIVVDGNHAMDHMVKEFPLLAGRSPSVIVFHDSSATRMNHPGCEGTDMAVKEWKAKTNYTWWEDSERREGMATHRGLFVAAKDEDVIRHISERFWMLTTI